MSLRWSKEEIDLLNSSMYTREELCKLLINRSQSAIDSKLHDINKKAKLSQKYKRFTNEEIKYIIDNCENLSVIQIAKNLNKTVSSIRNKMFSLGIRGIVENPKYTVEEFDFIKENFDKYSNSEFSEIMNIKRRRVELIIRKIGLRRNFNFDIKNSESVTCPNCKNIFPKIKKYFYFNENGELNKTTCKECQKKKGAEYVSTSYESFLKNILRGIKSDIKRKYKCDSEMDIDFEFLKGLYEKQEGKCAITGIKLEYEQVRGKKNLKNISVDRIDSKKGYIRGNIQLVCTWANLAKTNLSQDEFLDFIQLTFKNLIKCPELS